MLESKGAEEQVKNIQSAIDGGGEGGGNTNDQARQAGFGPCAKADDSTQSFSKLNKIRQIPERSGGARVERP